MANPTFSLQGFVARLLSNARRVVDAAPSDVNGLRMSQYNELFASLLGSGNQALADEGSYFLVANLTPGTGLATIATPTAFVATSPFLIIQNNEPAGGKSIVLDFIKLVCTAPGTAGTALHATSVIDLVNSRYSSGATLIVNATGPTGGQLSNPKSGVGGSTTVVAVAGPLVATAASLQARLLEPDMILKAAIPAVNDQYVIKFGGTDLPPSAVGLIGHAPVVIDPGHAFLLHLWLPSQSAASSYELSIGGWQR